MVNSEKNEKRQTTKKPKSTQKNSNSSKESNQNIIQQKGNDKFKNSTLKYLKKKKI